MLLDLINRHRGFLEFQVTHVLYLSFSINIVESETVGHLVVAGADPKCHHDFLIKGILECVGSHCVKIA